MPHLDIDTALSWQGRDVRDPSGEKIGTFGDVFLDRETQRPAWGGVRTGLFGRRETYIPLEEVEAADDALVVPFEKDVVRDAPQIDPDVALTAAEEEQLWRHYGQDYAPPAHAGEAPMDAGEPRTDDAITRSEEELRVGTTEREAAARG